MSTSGNGSADLVDRLASATLGGVGAALGLRDPVEHLTQAVGPLDLLGLDLGELLGALAPAPRPRRRAFLDLLEPLRRAFECLGRPALVRRQPLLGRAQLAGQLLLFGAVRLELVLGPAQLGEQGLAVGLRRGGSPLGSLGLGLRGLGSLSLRAIGLRSFGLGPLRQGPAEHDPLGLGALRLGACELDPLLGFGLHALELTRPGGGELALALALLFGAGARG